MGTPIMHEVPHFGRCNHKTTVLFDDKDIQVVALPRDGPLYKTTAFWSKSIRPPLLTRLHLTSPQDQSFRTQTHSSSDSLQGSQLM